MFGAKHEIKCRVTALWTRHLNVSEGSLAGLRAPLGADTTIIAITFPKVATGSHWLFDTDNHDCQATRVLFSRTHKSHK